MIPHAQVPSTIAEIAGNAGVPYSTARQIIKMQFPHVFRRTNGKYVVSGEDPVVPTIPTTIPTTIPKRAILTTHEPLPKPPPWTWNTDAIEYLSKLFGAPFKTVVANATKTNSLDQLVILGKTITHAAQEMEKYNASTLP